MPRSTCTTCGTPTPLGIRRCPAHPVVKPRNPNRGNGWAAQRWAGDVLARTDGRCRACGSRDGVQAHHVTPLAEGGSPFGPGVALCARCHQRVTNAERKARTHAHKRDAVR